MPLTTINGVLCLPVEEFQYYCHLLGLEQAALTDGPVYTSLRRAAEKDGMPPKHFSRKEEDGSGWSASYDAFSYAPDEWVVQEARKLVREAATSSDLGYAEIGEQDIEGEVWPGPDPGLENELPRDQYWTDEHGKKHTRKKADHSLTGPASLGGKILIELCYRLYIEVKKDEHAAHNYAKRERPDQRTLQPEAPAEK